MNPHDHNPAPSATATRGIVIVEPRGGRGDGKGNGKPSRPGGGKRQEPDLTVDANVFGDAVIYRLADDLIVPAIVERIVREALAGKDRKESK